MTIILTQAVRIAGTTQPIGTQLTLEGGAEGDLVHRGCATYVTDPHSGEGDTTVRATTNPLTGGITFSAAGSVVRLSDGSRQKTLLIVGDSISARSSFLGPDFKPRGTLRYYLTTALTNIANLVSYYAPDIRCPTGNGTLRFYLASMTMTWAANGETAGPAQNISAGGFFYLESSVANHGITISVLLGTAASPLANVPATDKSDTINVTGTPLNLDGMNNDWTTWLRALSGCDTINMAIAGISTSGVVTMLPQVVAQPADIAIVLLGWNDVSSTGAAGEVATFKANMTTIITALRNAGMPVIVCAPPAVASGYKTGNALLELVEMSNWCYDYALSVTGVDFADTHTALADPALTTGLGAAKNYNTTNSHPSGRGSYLIARAVWARLQKYITAPQASLQGGLGYDATYAPSGNLLKSTAGMGMFLGSGGGAATGEVAATGTLITPAGWTSTRTGTTLVSTTTPPATDGTPIPRTDGVPGNWYRQVISLATAADTLTVNHATAISTSNYADGDTVEFTVDIRLICTLNVSNLSYLQISLTAGSFTYRLMAGSAYTADDADDLGGDTVLLRFRSRPITLPTGTVAANVLKCAMSVTASGSGGFTWDKARVAVRKLAV